MKPGCIIFSKHLYNCKSFIFFQHNDAGYKICRSLEKQADGCQWFFKVFWFPKQKDFAEDA